jgi:hypothetical protein
MLSATYLLTGRLWLGIGLHRLGHLVPPAWRRTA